MERELGVSRCKLLYVEWIHINILLYSTGGHPQYPTSNHNGKKSIFEKNACMCITESLCCTAEIDTTL